MSTNCSIRSFAIAILDQISRLQSPFVVFQDPRYLKLLTSAIRSPSTTSGVEAVSFAPAVQVPICMILVMDRFSARFFSPPALLTALLRVDTSDGCAHNPVSSAYRRFDSWRHPMLTPILSTSATRITLSVYRLNRCGDKIQPCPTPFLMANSSECEPFHLITPLIPV